MCWDCSYIMCQIITCQYWENVWLLSHEESCSLLNTALTLIMSNYITFLHAHIHKSHGHVYRNFTFWCLTQIEFWNKSSCTYYSLWDTADYPCVLKWKYPQMRTKRFHGSSIVLPLHPPPADTHTQHRDIHRQDSHRTSMETPSNKEDYRFCPVHPSVSNEITASSCISH